MKTNKFPHGFEALAEVFNGTVKESTLNQLVVLGQNRPVWAVEAAEGRLTPYFFSIKALDVYVRSAKGKAEINRVCGQVFPNWDVDHKEWRK